MNFWLYDANYPVEQFDIMYTVSKHMEPTGNRQKNWRDIHPNDQDGKPNRGIGVIVWI